MTQAATLTADPVYALIASDAWSMRGLLRACEGLSTDQFHERFDIGFSSLHDTITHTLSATRRWTDRLAERSLRPALQANPAYPHIVADARQRTVSELRVLTDEAERDLLEVTRAIVRDGRLGSTLMLEWPGPGGSTKTYTFTRAAVIAHVTTHGFHHRAQCLNMLRRLGAPVPGVTEGFAELSVVDWQAEVESPPTIRKP